MTAEESKIMWELEKRLSENAGVPMSPEKEELYATVGELIEKEIITYDEFVEDVLRVIFTAANINDIATAEDRQSEMNELYIKLTEEYKQLNTKEDDKDIDR